MGDDGYMDAAAAPVPDAGDDTLREQVSRAVCAIAIGSERVETVMEIIQEHTAKLAERLSNVEAGREIEQTALRNAIGRMERVRKLADVSGWHVYESQDTGDVYPAALVQDRMADIRAALDGEATP